MSEIPSVRGAGERTASIQELSGRDRRETAATPFAAVWQRAGSGRGAMAPGRSAATVNGRAASAASRAPVHAPAPSMRRESVRAGSADTAPDPAAVAVAAAQATCNRAAASPMVPTPVAAAVPVIAPRELERIARAAELQALSTDRREVMLGIVDGAAAGATIAVRALGARRIEVSIGGSGAAAIGEAEIGSLVQALRARGLDVAEVRR